MLINPGTLTVEPTTLVVTAASQSRLYGQANPVLTVTYMGLVNGEDPNALGGTLLLNTTAETNSPVGVYPIQVSGQSSPNHDPVCRRDTDGGAGSVAGAGR